MDALALSTRCPLASAFSQLLVHASPSAASGFAAIRNTNKNHLVLPVCIPHSAPSGLHITAQTLLRTVRDLLVHAFVRIIPGHE